MATSNTDTGDTIISTTTEGAATSPREALITTAVNFLQNSKVRHTTLLQKRKFLQSKGLTAEEIQLACERSGVFTNDPNNPTTTINMQATHSQWAVQPRQSAFVKIREALHFSAMLGGIGYALYIFWKKYIEPFLFGKKKRKPIDEALEDIDKKVDNRIDEVGRELTQMKDTLTQQQREQQQTINREFSNFKNDLEAIKGLLLNRKQFASPLTAVPSSIPAWQLAASPQRHHHRHSQSDDNEKGDDGGSGSGSSETEVVTKNSDSSLEIM